MRDDEVREMGRLLDGAERLDRALETAQQVHDRAHDQELRRKIASEAVPPALHGAEEVHQYGPHWNDEQHGGDDRKRLGPVGNWAIEIMMDADERVEQGKGPKADQRELMSVERIAHADREEMVDEHVTGRRDPQAGDVVDVRAGKARAVS